MNDKLLIKYRISLSLFIVGLIVSGLTAFPLLTELSFLLKVIGIQDSSQYATLTGLPHWLAYVHFGLQTTYNAFPFLAYGTDWLAFAHLIIALFFIGPLVSPIRNEWIIYCGVIACIAVIPLAMICGHIRDIPFYWRMIDCSFGVFGIIPLIYCLHLSTLMRNQKMKANGPMELIPMPSALSSQRLLAHPLRRKQVGIPHRGR